MYFFYDNTGAPIAFWYFPDGGSRVTGYYFTNQQGDVVRIEDPDGNVLASYSYDAWGKAYKSSGSMRNINPLRFRGYYYDTETGFYYLQSRYYDPVVSRFINADSYASTGQGFLGYNMFAYCGNNPVSRVDASGSMHVRIDDFGGGGGLSVNGAGTVVYRSYGDGDVPFYGNPGGYAKSPNGTKERVYGPDGKPSRDRHHTDHGNSKNHPDVPHDHDWGFDENGKWKPGPAYPSPPGPLKPQEFQSNNNGWSDEVLTAVGMGIGGLILYELTKWGIAAILAPGTMGGSIIVAGAAP